MTKYNEEIIKRELENIINRIGHFPLKEELIPINKNLICAISRHGGFVKFRNLLGF